MGKLKSKLESILEFNEKKLSVMEANDKVFFLERRKFTKSI